ESSVDSKVTCSDPPPLSGLTRVPKKGAAFLFHRPALAPTIHSGVSRTETAANSER
ncbi:hypothetical protein AMECASPLE_034025, partial [Ameca splendens]